MISSIDSTFTNGIFVMFSYISIHLTVKNMLQVNNNLFMFSRQDISFPIKFSFETSVVNVPVEFKLTLKVKLLDDIITHGETCKSHKLLVVDTLSGFMKGILVDNL